MFIMASHRFDVTYKVLVLGESAVGKTALIQNYTRPDKHFNPSLLPTIGIDFRTEYKDIDGLKVRIQIWDTVGQERFRTMTKMFFRGAKGILLVYDTTSRESFNKVADWMDDLKEHRLDKEEIFLIGNKIDLGHSREVSPEDGKKISLRYGLKFYETSAKTGENVKKAFEQLVYNMKDANAPFQTGNDVGEEDWEQIFTGDLKVIDGSTDNRTNSQPNHSRRGWCCHS